MYTYVYTHMRTSICVSTWKPFRPFLGLTLLCRPFFRQAIAAGVNPDLDV